MIRYVHRDAVAEIVLDMPANDNKFTYALMNDFIAALERAVASEAVVLVLRATGAHFTLGRDQGEKLVNVSRKDSLKLILKANGLLRRFSGVSIALVQGRAMGFGSGLAVQTDISIAAHDAILGFDEIRHGLAPLVVLEYLPAYVGPKVARELIFTGRDVSAEEALRLGLVNQVVDAGQLGAAGQALVAELAGYSAGALRLIKGFEESLRSSEGEDKGIFAVERLIEWIEAGRP